MSRRPLPRRKVIGEIDRANLRPLPMTEKDWREFAHGVELFNAAKFWHAHEAWEQVWKRHAEDSRIFIQGLIQMAAAYHALVEKRRYTGTLNNFEKALMRLKLFEPEFMGVRVTPLVSAIERSSKEVQRLGVQHLHGFPPNLVARIEWRPSNLSMETLGPQRTLL